MYLKYIEFQKLIRQNNMEKQLTSVQWLSSHWAKLQKDGEKMSWQQIIDITNLVLEMERGQLISFGEFTSGLKREYNPSVGKNLWYGVIDGKHSGMTDDALLEHYFKNIKK